MFAIFSLPASGKVFFEDNFEKNKIGGKPKKWDDPGEQVLKVIKDPEGESGNVLEQKGEGMVREYRFPYCLLYTSPSPRDGLLARMPSSA